MMTAKRTEEGCRRGGNAGRGRKQSVGYRLDLMKHASRRFCVWQEEQGICSEKQSVWQIIIRSAERRGNVCGGRGKRSELEVPACDDGTGVKDLNVCTWKWAWQLANRQESW